MLDILSVIFNIEREAYLKVIGRNIQSSTRYFNSTVASGISMMAVLVRP